MFLKQLIKLLPSTLSNKLFTLSWGYRLLNYDSSYLVSIGYARSYTDKKPVDLDGNPLPWMNYAVIELFKERLNKEHILFEYGSGYSSLFFANYCKEVFSVEYDSNWLSNVEQLIVEHNITNIHLDYVELSNNYPLAIQNHNQRFDVVIIDGRMRVECANEALKHLSEDGIILLDDSDRSEYQPIFDLYITNGFKQITLKGIKPTGFTQVQTTLFYKANNVLGL